MLQWHSRVLKNDADKNKLPKPLCGQKRSRVFKHGEKKTRLPKALCGHVCLSAYATTPLCKNLD